MQCLSWKNMSECDLIVVIMMAVLSASSFHRVRPPNKEPRASIVHRFPHWLTMYPDGSNVFAPVGGVEQAHDLYRWVVEGLLHFTVVQNANGARKGSHPGRAIPSFPIIFTKR